MSFINFIEKLTESPKVSFEPTKCLKIRYPDYVCDRCSKICFCQAIEVSDDIVLNGEKCEGCGLCAGACPSEAFFLEDPSYHQLVEEAREKQQITLACPNIQSLGASKVPCLGYLPELLLMGFILSCQKVQIYHDKKRCTGCSRQAGTLIEERLNRVKKVAEGLGRAKVLKLDNGTQDEEISRGEFFKFLKTGSQRLAARVVSLSTEKRESKGNIKNLPESRRLLLSLIGKKRPYQNPIPLTGKYLPFNQIQVNKNCDGCGECTLYCPTGALGVTDDRRVEKIVHTPVRCINCGICLTKCSREALNRREFMDFGPVLAAESIPLHNTSFAPCSRCGRPVNSADRSGDKYLCSKCENELRQWSKSKKMLLNI